MDKLVRPRILTVETNGGLGNQLFQFAGGYGLAEAHGLELALDNTWFAARSLRRFELDLTCAQYLDKTHQLFWMVAGRRMRYRTELLSKGVARTFFRHVDFEKSTGLNHVYRVAAPSRISGYLQSWKYFADVAAEIRAQVTELRHPSSWYLEQRDALIAGKYGRWLAIHVRHGDYLQPEYQSSIGSLPTSYYQSAFEQISSHQSWDTLVVFSDSENALSWLGSLGAYPIVQFQSPPGTPSIETLLLMTLADGLISANSTFGWWAGWLGDRPDRPVALPSPWFANAPSAIEDYLWPGWIAVERDGGHRSN